MFDWIMKLLTGELFMDKEELRIEEEMRILKQKLEQLSDVSRRLSLINREIRYLLKITEETNELD